MGTIRVTGCACDWREKEVRAFAGLARDLLMARDVRRVRIGIWMIRGPVERADPSAPLKIVAIEAPELDAIEWTRDFAFDVRRSSLPPFPTHTLAQLARRGA